MRSEVKPTLARPPESVWNVDDRREEEFEERFGVGAEPRVTFARRVFYRLESAQRVPTSFRNFDPPSHP